MANLRGDFILKVFQLIKNNNNNVTVIIYTCTYWAIKSAALTESSARLLTLNEVYTDRRCFTKTDRQGPGLQLMIRGGFTGDNTTSVGSDP